MHSLKRKKGTLAQVVEQWTENPCVLGSTPRGTTSSFHSIRFPSFYGAGFLLLCPCGVYFTPFCFVFYIVGELAFACLAQCTAVVAHAFDGRRTMCMAAVVHIILRPPYRPHLSVNRVQK